MKIQGNLSLEGSQLKEFRIDNVSSLPTVGSTDRGRTVIKTGESPKWWDGTKWNKFSSLDSSPIENAYIHYSFTENSNGRYTTIANAISAGHSELYIYATISDDYSHTLPLNMSNINIYGIGNNGMNSVILFAQNLPNGLFSNCTIHGDNIFIVGATAYYSKFSSCYQLTLDGCNIDVNDMFNLNLSLSSNTTIKSKRIEKNIIDVVNGSITSTNRWWSNYINIAANCICQLDISGNEVLYQGGNPEYSRIQNSGMLIINKFRNTTESVLTPYSLANEACYDFINNDGNLIIYECNLRIAFQDTAARYFITNNSASCSTYMTNTIIKFGTAFSNALINNGATVKFAVGSVITNKGFNGYGPTTGTVYNSNNYFN